MQEESNFMICVDEEGNEFTVEIIQYVNENGQDYVVVAEVPEDDEECDCDECDCEGHDVALHVMQVNPINDEEDEYLPVDEATETRILEILAASAEEWDDEDDEDDEDE